MTIGMMDDLCYSDEGESLSPYLVPGSFDYPTGSLTNITDLSPSYSEGSFREAVPWLEQSDRAETMAVKETEEESRRF